MFKGLHGLNPRNQAFKQFKCPVLNVLRKMHKNREKMCMCVCVCSCTEKMASSKDINFQGWDKSRTYNIPRKRPERWLCTSHWHETMGFPWPIMQRNLYVRRTLSVTRTEQDSGKSTTLPPAEQQNFCTINHYGKAEIQ